MTSVKYYKDTQHEYITEFLNSISPKQQSKVIRIIHTIEEYGLTSANPHLKKIFNTPFWEIRILGKDNIRILYVSVILDEIILIHGFIKKTQKTPTKEIKIAMKRYQQLIDN
ncbi:MAG TPA: type II toxin-antitoxin system RelE/ParE family toxin [Candidatus Methanoperedens sp.]|nr:type II toxin-antitoxin system RelE/ParE family toxin [Candidatus Methanoperedens sp.]